MKEEKKRLIDMDEFEVEQRRRKKETANQILRFFGLILEQTQGNLPYWLALKQAKKAASVDASVRKLANKTALSYEGRAPSKTDIFSEAMSGKTISFKCWIGKSVTVPSLN